MNINLTLLSILVALSTFIVGLIIKFMGDNSKAHKELWVEHNKHGERITVVETKLNVKNKED